MLGTFSLNCWIREVKAVFFKFYFLWHLNQRQILTFHSKILIQNQWKLESAKTKTKKANCNKKGCISF